MSNYATMQVAELKKATSIIRRIMNDDDMPKPQRVRLLEAIQRISEVRAEIEKQ